ncbi:MAG: hypothetical protein ACQGVC_08160 [Myxococcota bacterium]
MGFLRRLYAGWMTIVGRFGATQTMVVLGLFYAFLIGPASIISTLARRDLLDKRRSETGDASAWRDADTSPPDLERAKLTS